MLETSWDKTCTYGQPVLHHCDLCGKAFPLKWKLEIHQLTQAGSRYCR